MIQLGNLTLSDEDLAVIAHVVHNETPEEWATRVFNYPKTGAPAIVAKIAQYRESYLAAKDEPGYQTAAQHMEDRRTADQARLDKNRNDAAARKIVVDLALDARIQAEVTRQLAARV